MIIYKSDSRRFILGLVFIIIIYSLNFIFFVENVTLKLNPIQQHIISFSITIIVYFIGTIHLRTSSTERKWILSLWHLIHISGLFIITFLGLFDWFISDIHLSLNQFAHSIQEMLISPVLYAVMGLLNKTLKN